MKSIEAAGSDSLQERLWRAHAVELVRYGSLLVGPHNAHDIVSAAFERFALAARTVEVEHHRSYLFRAVTNEAHDHHRRQASRWRRDLLAVAATAQPATDTHLDVRRAVACLSVRQRAVVYFVYWEDLSERSIAELLAISPGAVRRHLTRARVHLRKALQ